MKALSQQELKLCAIIYFVSIVQEFKAFLGQMRLLTLVNVGLEPWGLTQGQGL